MHFKPDLECEEIRAVISSRIIFLMLNSCAWDGLTVWDGMTSTVSSGEPLTYVRSNYCQGECEQASPASMPSSGGKSSIVVV